MKKLLSMLLAAAMLVSASAMAFAEGTSEKGTIVYGSSTEIRRRLCPQLLVDEQRDRQDDP